MQDRYAGDIGDYGKYGLLRYLANKGIKIDVPVAMSGNFGFGGHNGILVFKKVN